ncbi:MAG: type II toxin-antitoxin system YafQ family toxin [Defluviitaleaceae bacterium]|nr:type II toxin-antitoxin system YafQ family toxin [Defluviitaleaceae bacterium]
MTETKRYIRRTAQFKKEYRKSKKQGKDMALALNIINMLANDESLPEKYNDHALMGNWKGYRECHITPDWLLVYRKTDNGELLLILSRLASHSQLDF